MRRPPHAGGTIKGAGLCRPGLDGGRMVLMFLNGGPASDPAGA